MFIRGLMHSICGTCGVFCPSNGLISWRTPRSSVELESRAGWSSTNTEVVSRAGVQSWVIPLQHRGRQSSWSPEPGDPPPTPRSSVELESRAGWSSSNTEVVSRAGVQSRAILLQHRGRQSSWRPEPGDPPPTPRSSVELESRAGRSSSNTEVVSRAGDQSWVILLQHRGRQSSWSPEPGDPPPTTHTPQLAQLTPRK